MSTDTQAPEFKALDYVYCGLVFRNKEFYVAVTPINEDGTLQKEGLYLHKKGGEKVIGGIYRGALFSEKSSSNLDAASFVEKYHDTESIIQWKARNDQAKTQDRILKLEKDAEKGNEMDAMLITVRKLYSNYRKRNDFAGMEAIEAAMLRSLRTPIRQSEAE
jgi:hypothetical protein